MVVRGASTWYSYLLLGYFTYVMTIQGNVLPFLKAELELSYRVASLHTSLIASGLIVLGLVGERFSGYFGRGAAMRIGILGSAAALLFLSLAPAAWASLASCALFGLFGGLIPMLVNVSLSELHGSRREVAFTEANAVAYGFALMAPVISAACVWLGLNWRMSILVAAAAGIAIMLRFLGARLPEVDRHRPAGSARLSAGFWFMSAALALSAALEFSVLLWAPAYLEQVVGLPASTAAIGAAAFFLAMLAGRTASSWLIHRIPARTLFLFACATTFVGFAAYWGAHAPTLVIAGLFVVGLGISVAFPLLLGFAMSAAPDAGDRAASRVMLLSAVAILLGPPILGSLADTVGLALAQLMTPVVAALMAGAFFAGEILERRHPAARAAPATRG
jgi:fucose permease